MLFARWRRTSVSVAHPVGAPVGAEHLATHLRHRGCSETPASGQRERFLGAAPGGLHEDAADAGRVELALMAIPGRQRTPLIDHQNVTKAPQRDADGLVGLPYLRPVIELNVKGKSLPAW